jgi:hypothetical protein
MLSGDDSIDCFLDSIKSSLNNILLYDNVKNFIPNNDIGLECTLLNTKVTPTDKKIIHMNRYPSIV